MKTNTHSRIAIVGAGPGGLTLARLLQIHAIPATVFELDRSPDVRSEGGTLDLDPESGQLALHLAGLDEQFRAIARYEDQGVRLLAKDGTIIFETEQDQVAKDRPEIDRAELRTLLLDSLNPGTVRWGHHLRSVRQTNDGTHELVFDHDQAETFDLVVGADGAWSRVRPFLSSASPFYAGVAFIEITLKDVDQRHPTLAHLVGHGTMFALAENKGLIAQRNNHGVVRVYAALRREASEDVDTTDPQRVRTWLLNQFSAWDESLLALIRECDDQFIFRPLSMLPVDHRWGFHAGVTLLGDAAHLMTPFAGQGVNLAMQDALDLATSLSENKNLEQAVRTYEKVMIARAEMAARITDRCMNTMMAPSAPAGVLDLFREFMFSEPV